MFIIRGKVGIPIDGGSGLSITIDKLRVFINKTLSTESLINQLLIRGLVTKFLSIGMPKVKRELQRIYIDGCQYNERLNGLTVKRRDLNTVGVTRKKPKDLSACEREERGRGEKYYI